MEYEKEHWWAEKMLSSGALPTVSTYYLGVCRSPHSFQQTVIAVHFWH